MDKLDMDGGRRETLLSLAQDLVRTPSLSGHEEEAIRLLADRMAFLGYDEVTVDAFGNLLGRIGGGGRGLLLASHIDTVAVPDEAAWRHPPFSGTIAEGLLWGRGSVDMKGGLAASVLAPVLARDAGLLEGKTVWVAAGCLEEDCDGEDLRHLLAESGITPGACLICEPSRNRIVHGHKGKVQARILTRGLSAHGSAPERGRNAIYAMAEVIRRTEALDRAFRLRPAPRPTIVMSRIASVAASLNAVPASCECYLDRRSVPGETASDLRAELDALVAGLDAAWEVGSLERETWTGLRVAYEPLHEAWRLGGDGPLERALAEAFEAATGRPAGAGGFWDFSTDAVATLRAGIPTIGLGPGDPSLAHMVDEACPVEELVEACRIYATFLGRW